MSEESKTLGAGGETIVANIADIVVIKAIRYWLDTAPEANKGWLGALKDPKIGKALTAIHAHLELDFSIALVNLLVKRLIVGPLQAALGPRRDVVLWTKVGDLESP
jgi:hypothetical protein